MNRATGLVHYFLGDGTTSFNGDGNFKVFCHLFLGILATSAACSNPHFIMINPRQPELVYVSCQGQSRIRLVNVTSGIVTTFMGTGSISPTSGGDGMVL